MILESAGKLSADFFAIGSPEFPSYLLQGRGPVLFESGMTFLGPGYLRDLKVHLGENVRPEYLLLTHSHYDHAGSAPFLKRSIPGLKVGAGKLAAEIFRRPNAIRLIQDLSRGMEEKFQAELAGADVRFRGLELDLLLQDGDEAVPEDGAKIQVIATPGHTRDTVSYYLPGFRALIAGEAVGSLDRKRSVRPNFLSSYRDYISSLEKLRLLPVEIVFLGHHFTLTGADAEEMAARSIDTARLFKERIEEALYLSHGDREAAARRIFQKDYIEDRLISQDQRPFFINLEAQVKAVAEGR